jgi:hypothetical protein
MMRTDAGFHANQARLHVGKPRFDLAARPLLPQHDCTALILDDIGAAVAIESDIHSVVRRNGFRLSDLHRLW